jgi:ribosomal-protein-alanine N-acetyltransferase
MGLDIRWMIRRDMNEILEIEKRSFPNPWTDEEFIRCLRQRNCIGKTADLDDKVVGFLIYELHKDRLHLLNFAVAPTHRRQGIGKRMVGKLTGILTPHRRNRILLETRETNLASQLFFRSHGFEAVSILRDYYDDTTEDAYVMQYRVKEPATPAAPKLSR